MIDNQEIKNKYNEVGSLLESALENASGIELVGEKENAELKMISDFLSSKNEEFKGEIDKLEDSSEWNKFCIAFFGETNAGKSTIIESLRIIYDEENRRLEKIEQTKEYKRILDSHCNDFQDLIFSLKNLNDALIIRKNSWVKRVIFGVVCLGVGIVIGLLL